MNNKHFANTYTQRVKIRKVTLRNVATILSDDMPSRVHESYYADHSVRLLKAIFEFELNSNVTVNIKKQDEN